MHEILFRGKRKDNNEWVYGFFSKDNYDNCYIIKPILLTEVATFEWVKIIPETQGQLMPIKDANGAPLYEGDIVYGKRTLDNWSELPATIGKKLEYREVKFTISEFDVSFSLPKDISYSERIPENNIRWQLIGNKFDNPELLQSI